MPVHPFPPVRSRRVSPRQRRRGVRPSFARSLILVAAGGFVGTLAVLQMAGAPPAAFADLSARTAAVDPLSARFRSEEHTSELQSLMRTSYAVFCLKKKKQHKHYHKND